MSVPAESAVVMVFADLYLGRAADETMIVGRDFVIHWTIVAILSLVVPVIAMNVVALAFVMCWPAQSVLRPMFAVMVELRVLRRVMTAISIRWTVAAAFV